MGMKRELTLLAPGRGTAETLALTTLYPAWSIDCEEGTRRHEGIMAIGLTLEGTTSRVESCAQSIACTSIFMRC